MPSSEAAAVGAEPLAPQDHDILTAVAQQRASSVFRVCPPLGGEPGDELGLLAGGEPNDDLGVGVQRARSRGGDRELDTVPANALADSQVEDRRVVERLATEDEHGVRELDVGDGRLELRSGERAGELELGSASGAGVDVIRGEALATQAPEKEALLVGGLAADQRAHAALVLGQPGCDLQRALPRDLAQLATVAHERSGDPLVDVDRLVGEAPLVAEPPVVDAGMAVAVARQHAHHLLVADREGDIALRGAQRADPAGRLDVPRAGAEAVGLTVSAPTGHSSTMLPLNGAT